jgi:hypothetical protein
MAKSRNDFQAIQQPYKKNNGVTGSQRLKKRAKMYFPSVRVSASLVIET